MKKMTKGLLKGIIVLIVATTILTTLCSCGDESFNSLSEYIIAKGELQTDSEPNYYYLKASNYDESIEYATMYYHTEGHYANVKTEKTDSAVTILLIITDTNSSEHHILYTEQCGDEIKRATGTLNSDGLTLNNAENENGITKEIIESEIKALINGINENILKESGYTLEDIGLKSE